jgi:hypothetical protein
MTMRKTTEREIFCWAISEQMKDPYFADGACLLSYAFGKMEKKVMGFSKCRKNCKIRD